MIACSKLRRLACSLVLISTCVTEVVAAPQNQSSIRRSSSLVLVPVSALDGSGRFVSGLSVRDFQILVDGRPIAITDFDVVTEHGQPASTSPYAAPELPPNTLSNISEFSANQPNLVIFLVDYLNTRLVDRMGLRAGMLTYLATKLKPAHEIAVYGLTYRLVVLQPFTRNSSQLINVARDLLKQNAPGDPIEGKPLIKPGANPIIYAGQPDAGMEFFASQNARREYNLDQLHRAQRTLEAFREIADSFEGIPGKKTVIWLTGDASPLNPTLLYRIVIENPNVETVATPWWEMAKTYELMNAAGISVFPLDIRGLDNPGLLSASAELSHDDFEQTFRRGSQPDDLSSYANPTDLRQGEAANAKLAMSSVAAETGGTVLAGTNDIDGLLARAQKLWANYYVLAFVPENVADSRLPSYHEIKVNVHRRGVQILARRGYVSRPESLISAESEIQRDLIEAAASPVDLTSVPLRLAFGEPREMEKMRHFPFSVTVSGIGPGILPDREVPYDITIAVLLRDQDGRVSSPVGKRVRGVLSPSQVSDAAVKGLKYNAEFQASVGTPYFGRVIVRDNLTGRLGSLTLALPSSSSISSAR